MKQILTADVGDFCGRCLSQAVMGQDAGKTGQPYHNHEQHKDTQDTHKYIHTCT